MAVAEAFGADSPFCLQALTTSKPESIKGRAWDGRNWDMGGHGSTVHERRRREEAAFRPAHCADGRECTRVPAPPPNSAVTHELQRLAPSCCAYAAVATRARRRSGGGTALDSVSALGPGSPRWGSLRGTRRAR